MTFCANLLPIFWGWIWCIWIRWKMVSKHIEHLSQDSESLNSFWKSEIMTKQDDTASWWQTGATYHWQNWIGKQNKPHQNSSCYTFKHNKLLNCTYTLTLLVATIEIMLEVCIYRVKHTPTFSRSKCHFFWLFHPLIFFAARLLTIMHIFDDNF